MTFSPDCSLKSPTGSGSLLCRLERKRDQAGLELESNARASASRAATSKSSASFAGYAKADSRTAIARGCCFTSALLHSKGCALGGVRLHEGSDDCLQLVDRGARSSFLTVLPKPQQTHGASFKIDAPGASLFLRKAQTDKKVKCALDRGEAGRAKRLSAQDAKPNFHLVEPGSVRGREMKMNVGMRGQPTILPGFVSVQIVQNHVDSCWP